jgi:hypothetical protein
VAGKQENKAMESIANSNLQWRLLTLGRNGERFTGCNPFLDFIQLPGAAKV